MQTASIGYAFYAKLAIKSCSLAGGTQYTLRLNNVGEFSLPPSRVEAMYAPEMFGVAPNARVIVK